MRSPSRLQASIATAAVGILGVAFVTLRAEKQRKRLIERRKLLAEETSVPVYDEKEDVPLSCRANSEAEIRFAKSGVGAAEAMTV